MPAGSQYCDSYYLATANRQLDLPRLQDEETADVCIIGAGYMGLSSAIHLAERGYQVVVLEAERVGWGASGRNGGQCTIGQRQPQELHSRGRWSGARVVLEWGLRGWNVANPL